MRNHYFYCLILLAMVGLIIVQPGNSQAGSAPKDGALSFPKNYDSFPTFLKAIQKPKHVRELFVNPTGSKTQKGEKFPNGSILVMEIYNAKKGADGSAAKRPDGRNAKDNLAKVYVMQKGDGWGKNAPKGLENGDWVYTAFSPEGNPIKADYTKCRGCHLPLNEHDFVHRYNEYFEKRKH